MLRILVPFIIGIIMASVCSSVVISVTIGVAAIFGWIILKWAFPHTPQWSMRLRPIWIIPITLVAFSLGWINTLLCSPPIINNKTIEGSIAQAQIHKIQFNDYSMTMQATLSSVVDSCNNQLIKNKHKILITTRGCDYTLKAGDIIQFNLSLDSIKNLGNPNEFDYANYLYRQGIIYKQHISAINQIIVTDHAPSILDKCYNNRKWIEKQVFESQLPDDVQAFIIATILGDNSLIDNDTRVEFAQAGISHILALSGIHIGIIMILVWFILMPLDYLKLKRLRLAITIFAMILFAVFTGLSPSVIRSTVMMAVALTGMIFYRKSITINSLATAALVILAIDPMTIYSIGFQFSFITVLTLLVFLYPSQTKITSGTKRRNRVSAWAFSLLASTIIAMLATTMLTAFYFNTISLQSIISNLFILPILPFEMIVAAIFIMLCCIGVKVILISEILTYLYKAISGIAIINNSIFPISFDYIYVGKIDLVLYFIILTIGYWWWKTSKASLLYWIAVCLVIFIANITWEFYSSSSTGFIIFNSYDSTPVLSYKGRTGLLWVCDNEELDITNFKQSHRGFCANKHLREITKLDNNNNLKQLGNKSIACVGYGKWKKQPGLETKIKVDILVVTKRFHSTIKKLLEIYEPDTIVLSGDIYDTEHETLENECIQLNINYYSIKKQGAYIVSNNP